jgi:hypothetical protein
MASAACGVIVSMLSRENVPDDSVFRITSQPEAGRVIAVTDSPKPDDQIVRGEEVEVCV